MKEALQASAPTGTSRAWKRAEILQRFLDRKRIYTTEHFAAKYQQTARRNLESSIRIMGMNIDPHLHRIVAAQPYPLREAELPLRHHQRRTSLRISIVRLIDSRA